MQSHHFNKAINYAEDTSKGNKEIGIRRKVLRIFKRLKITPFGGMIIARKFSKLRQSHFLPICMLKV